MPQETNDKEERWIKENWRPAMAWQYLAVCLFDFLIAPILTGIYAFYAKIPYVPWEPITLKESALYHLAMGAVIGVVAWSRGQEKMRRWDMLRPPPSYEEEEEDRFPGRNDRAYTRKENPYKKTEDDEGRE